MTDEVLMVMAKYDNICKYVHLPVQSGNSALLEKMNRGYTRAWFLNRISAIKKYMPDCGLSTDIITGFCGETPEQHNDTLQLMREVKFDFAYMFKYSERPKTLAQRKYADDVSEEIKSKRLDDVIALQKEHSHENNLKQIGKTFKVLVEGLSKKSDQEMFGRNSQNTTVIFPKKDFKKGMYVEIKITGCTPATLLGEPVN
jgi:tRNA-2-methylthio-N6-dimethylallyladenosine synthase